MPRRRCHLSSAFIGLLLTRTKNSASLRCIRLSIENLLLECSLISSEVHQDILDRGRPVSFHIVAKSPVRRFEFSRENLVWESSLISPEGYQDTLDCGRLVSTHTAAKSPIFAGLSYLRPTLKYIPSLWCFVHHVREPSSAIWTSVLSLIALPYTS
jgi:hypothetical protein